jgi:hypothetical protein
MVHPRWRRDGGSCSRGWLIVIVIASDGIDGPDVLVPGQPSDSSPPVPAGDSTTSTYSTTSADAAPAPAS